VPEVRTASTTLFVEQMGEGEALVVAHGGPGLSHDLYRTLEPLARGRRLVLFDHRGHGRSAPLPEGEIEMSLFADDLVELADALGVGRFDLLGHSMGGWVALEAALRHPGRVRSLVAVATTPGQLGQNESPEEDQGPPMDPEAEALLMSQPASDEELVATYRALAPYFIPGPGSAALIDALDVRLAHADSFAKVFGALSRWSAIDRLAECEVPMLVLAGGRDQFCAPAQSRRIASRAPRASMAVFEGLGHFMWLEDPAPFFDEVAGWLDR
jgi:pimeloyl-ACP methyl ester carboxylesterase